MKLLLDTHAFLWFVLGDSKLSAIARAEIESPPNGKLLSPANDREIAIKISRGKYTTPLPFDDFIEQAWGEPHTISLDHDRQQRAPIVGVMDRTGSH